MVVPLVILWAMGLTGSMMAVVRSERRKDSMGSVLASLLIGVQLGMVATVGFVWWWMGELGADWGLIVGAFVITTLAWMLVYPPPSRRRALAARQG